MRVKKTVKFIGVIAIVLIVLLLLFVGVHFLNPLTHSNKSVKKYVLRNIPIGTTYDEVLAIVENRDWQIEHENDHAGLMVIIPENRAVFFDESEVSEINENPSLRITGSRSLQVLLGEYRNPLPAAVYAWMAFDEQGKMIELFISREIDGP